MAGFGSVGAVLRNGGYMPMGYACVPDAIALARLSRSYRMKYLLNHRNQLNDAAISYSLLAGVSPLADGS